MKESGSGLIGIARRTSVELRLAAGETEAITDLELLEFLLSLALGDQRASRASRELLSRFGDIADVITEDPRRLLEVPGVSAEVIALFQMSRLVTTRLARRKVAARPLLSSSRALIRYCRAVISREKTERVRILFLDKKNFLIADEAQQKGTVDHVPVYPREIVKRALELNASSIILVHNHPSGDPTPSAEDVEMTKRIVETARPLGIEVHDHLIITKGRHASFRSLGLI